MRHAQDHYPNCPEAMIVSLARTGDRDAFADLVRRRQSSVRNLMRRCCGDNTLADDLAQQVFMQVLVKIHSLKESKAFGGWLKRIGISVWLQHLRKKDALKDADELGENEIVHKQANGIGMDLNRALSTLPNPVRLCVVLAYQVGMTHQEIAELADMPLGTVKSHINRGSQRLQQILAAYKDNSNAEISS